MNKFLPQCKEQLNDLQATGVLTTNGDGSANKNTPATGANNSN